MIQGQDNYFQPVSFSNRQGEKIIDRNVVGLLEGSDPALKDEYILVTAHFDHIGISRAVNGDSINNGADDNASGVVAMLTMMHNFKKQGIQPKRSIIFVAFTGEEMGLQGSKYYANNPVYPLEKTNVNLNFEMVAHSEKLGKRKFYLTGDTYSDLATVIRSSLNGTDWELIDDPFREMQLFYRSDNASFVSMKIEGDMKYGIPAHTLCTWGTESHYHRPNDQVDIVDFENMTSFVNMISKVSLDIANRPAQIKWTSDEFSRYAGK